MAGNPNWWGMMNNTMHPQSHHQLSSQFAYVSNSPADHPLHSDGQDFPVRSWSQLLLGGLAAAAAGGVDGDSDGDERYGANIFQQQKKLENWEDQVMLNLNNDPSPPFAPRLVGPISGVKQEDRRSDSRFYGGLEEGFDASELSDSWPGPALSHRTAGPVSSPASCVTTLSGNILSFSGGTKPKNQTHDQERSSECNSRVNGGATKKARVTQPSSAQPALKVRKEKLGDRISTLHQLVSPFGKTDTASVLSEAIGYIRFLQGQIEALSCPYMRNASESSRSHQHSVQERNCMLTDEPFQFLNDFDIDGGGGAPNQESQGRQGAKDLRSRGLCLVPIDCTQHVGNENGADYWAQAAFGGGF